MRIALVALAALSVAACGTQLAYLPMNDPPRAMQPRAPETVAMFASARPDRPYVEVGLIEGQQEIYSVDANPTVLRKMREEAAQRGCDGLLLLGSNDRVTSHGVQNGAQTYTLTGYRASCIVFTAPASGDPASR